MSKKASIVAGLLALCLLLGAAATAVSAASAPRMVYDTWYTAEEGSVYVFILDEEDTTAPAAEANRVLLEARKCEMDIKKGEIKDEFYLGLLDDSGEPLTGERYVSAVSLYSKDAETIARVLYWEETENVWQDISFQIQDGEVLLKDVKTGAYCFIVADADGADEEETEYVPSVQQPGISASGSEEGEPGIVFVYDNVAEYVLTEEARSTVLAALESATESGVTAESMGITGQKAVSMQFYLGVRDEYGNLADSFVGDVSLEIDSEDILKTISGVYRWDGSAWISVDYTVGDGTIDIEDALVGVYRFVSDIQ